MPVVKARPAGQKTTVRLLAKLSQEHFDILEAYAFWIGEPTDYVLGQLVEQILAKDKDFIASNSKVTKAHKTALDMVKSA